MAFEHYVRSGQKMLRCGYTTGTCAALASQAAVYLLFRGSVPENVSVLTRKGWEVTVPVDEYGISDDGSEAWCGIRKDAGDDIDATDGIMIRASVKRSDEPGVHIDGGKGVGRVTLPGADQPVGNAAINRVPREMIEESVTAMCDDLGYDGGIDVVISVPEGEETAGKTFNPVMGIKGGISILGTTGIVDPMSEKGLLDSIEAEVKQKAALSKDIIFTPGNYGETYMKNDGGFDYGVPIVMFSNFLGDMLDIAVQQKFENVLVVAHVGKLVKVAGGVMNTHSRYADCRTEIFCAHAAVNGADTETCRKLMDAATTDACIDILDKAGLKDKVLKSILDAVQVHLDRRAGGAYNIGAVMFSNKYGFLGETDGAVRIRESWEKRKKESFTE